MHDAARLFALGALAGLMLAACGQARSDGSAGNEAQTTEIEALPVDESDATPTNELMNGDDEADVDTGLENDSGGPADY